MVTHRWWGNKFCKRKRRDAVMRPPFGCPRECRDAAIDFGIGAHVDRDELHAQRDRRPLDRRELANTAGHERQLPPLVLSLKAWQLVLRAASRSLRASRTLS